MTKVRFFALENGQDVEIGQFRWDGKSVTATPRVERLLDKRIVAPGAARALTKDDGEAFMRGLSSQYRSAYLRALPPERDEGFQEIPDTSL